MREIIGDSTKGKSRFRDPKKEDECQKGIEITLPADLSSFILELYSQKDTRVLIMKTSCKENEKETSKMIRIEKIRFESDRETKFLGANLTAKVLGIITSVISLFSSFFPK